MSNLFQIFNAHKAYATKILFDGASFSINEGEHVGVIGPNGAGKTTLFRVLSNQEQLDSGEFVKSRGLKIGYLSQYDDWLEGESVEDYLARGTQTPIWDLKALGIGLGLSEEVYTRPLKELSGGYRMRAKLLHLIGQETDVMLLDEPTNYLDLESLLVLEKFLQNYKKSFLLISHDREFLRRTTNHTLEIEAGDMVKYNGNLDAYFEQKNLLAEQLEARAQNIEQKRKEVIDFANRFRAQANKARQVQSRLKSLDRLEEVETKKSVAKATIRLPEPIHTGKSIVDFSSVDLGYDDKAVLKDINFQVERGDHLVVVGVNGAGKSTFLKSIASQLKPQKGNLKWGMNVSVGYFAQHVSEALSPEWTVLQALQQKAHIDVLPQQILDLAGSLLFAGDDIHKKVSVLSGGEKSRVALGQILLQKAPCLVLDEPTNHLDFETVEALTEALSQYSGTLIVVSHDRSFMKRVGHKVLEVRQGRVEVYPGTYSEYLWSLEKGTLSQRSETPTSNQAIVIEKTNSSKVDRLQRKDFDRLLRQTLKDISKTEKSISVTQSHIDALNKQIVDEAQSPLLLQWTESLNNFHKELETLEEEWLELCSNKEKYEKLLTR